jgi:hypothetical protein
MNIFWTFSCGQLPEKIPSVISASTFISWPHFRFVESHGLDL